VEVPIFQYVHGYFFQRGETATLEIRYLQVVSETSDAPAYG
jgi:hypothetical protein